MNNLMEYIIGITVVYADGRKEGIALKQKDLDAESARLAVLREFKDFEQQRDVQKLISTVQGCVT